MTMRIKLHNSMGKFDSNCGSPFLFDEKIFIGFSSNILGLRYKIYDHYYFLSFSPETKEFEKLVGFGENEKHPNPEWWTDTCFKWKEMRK